MVDLFIQLVVTLFLIMIMVIIGVSMQSSEKEPEYPPKGYAIDYMLMNMDDVHGISKAEKNRRIKSGYYLKPCDKYGCIDRKIMGRK